MLFNNITKCTIIYIVRDTKTELLTNSSQMKGKVKIMMKMPKTYRVYTNVKKIGEDYYEASYKEYTGNKLTGYGTEDFSKERLKTATKR